MEQDSKSSGTSDDPAAQQEADHNYEDSRLLCYIKRQMRELSDQTLPTHERHYRAGVLADMAKLTKSLDGLQGEELTIGFDHLLDALDANLGYSINNDLETSFVDEFPTEPIKLKLSWESWALHIFINIIRYCAYH